MGLTAVVHLFNNFFKMALLGKHADRWAVIHFGLPAILSSLLGAWVLVWLSDLKPLIQYQFFEHTFFIIPVKLIVALMMVIFSLFEVIPKFEKLSFNKKYLLLGGMLSGFFGGLSGHQGALRSAFLIKYGLSKESFIATGVVVAILVDITRISVYSTHFSMVGIAQNGTLLIAAIVSAFLGAFWGNRLLKKITLLTIQLVVSIMLFIIAIGLGAGFI